MAASYRPSLYCACLNHDETQSAAIAGYLCDLKSLSIVALHAGPNESLPFLQMRPHRMRHWTGKCPACIHIALLRAFLEGAFELIRLVFPKLQGLQLEDANHQAIAAKHSGHTTDPEDTTVVGLIRRTVLPGLYNPKMTAADGYRIYYGKAMRQLHSLSAPVWTQGDCRTRIGALI